MSEQYLFNFQTKYEKEYIVKLKYEYENLNEIQQKINWVYDTVDFFKQFNRNIELKIFLGEYAEKEKNKRFKSYLYFLISNLYWEEDKKEASFFYIKKIDPDHYDLEYNSQSIGYTIALRVISMNVPFRDKEYMYNLLLKKYSDMIDIPYTAYELAKLYKTNLDIEKAIETLKYIINFVNNSKNVEDSVNISEIKREVDFYYMKKNWIYNDLEDLINNIKYAIITKNVTLLSNYVSKINFSCSIYNKSLMQQWGWNQLAIDRFWNSNIVFSSKLEDISNENEAYLKTFNWGFPQLTTWYFYFKRVNYPYDKSIDRGWEWAGIIFGDMF
ncbi:MAG TPA: hypothetical protein PLE45_02355 [Spirochaetota bacterium]|nr:hypothetical protein [Spirochaetota bacterium]HPP04111.1 hypothetical protein [Spirochaetota bacterium]